MIRATSPPNVPTHPSNPRPPLPRLLITAGPTHEPIDAVRYIGNRSSGRLGIALADRAAATGWSVTLLLGPTGLTPADSRVRVFRFRTTAELDVLLRQEFPACEALIMAAAVADYRPRSTSDSPANKLRREDRNLTITLEPTPDLLAGVAAGKRPDQVVVGFALEPSDRLMDSAAAKLTRKSLDMVVANPLETMEALTIDATLLRSDGSVVHLPPAIDKPQFAALLLDDVRAAVAAKMAKLSGASA